MSCFQSSMDGRRWWRELLRWGLNSFGGLKAELRVLRVLRVLWVGELFEFSELCELWESASSVSLRVLQVRASSSQDWRVCECWSSSSSADSTRFSSTAELASELRWEESRVVVWFHCIVIGEDNFSFQVWIIFKICVREIGLCVMISLLRLILADFSFCRQMSF